MNTKNIITSLIIAILVVGASQLFFPAKLAGNAADRSPAKTTFTQVDQRKSINCGYISYQPAIFNDENGNVVGIFAEAMEKAAGNLGWKVNWVEGNWPDLIPNLNSKRWDAFCAAAWKNAVRVRAADFGIPLYYSFLSVWGKEELKTTPFTELNSANYVVAVLDGDTSLAVAEQKFPSAKRSSLTELNSYSDIFDLIVSDRADFTIAEGSFVKKYNVARNETKLFALGDGPISIYPNAMMFRKEDIALRRAVNGALEELVNEGVVGELIEKYAPGEVLRTARPYEQ